MRCCLGQVHFLNLTGQVFTCSFFFCRSSPSSRQIDRSLVTKGAAGICPEAAAIKIWACLIAAALNQQQVFGQRSVSVFEESDSSSTPVATPPERDDCGHTGSTASVGVTQRAGRNVCVCVCVEQSLRV